MHIQTDRALVPAGAPAVRYLHIIVNAPAGKQQEESRPPASIALVLDRSGSMDGQKLQMAREAVAHATRLLKPTDYLAIVCYDDEVTTVLDRTHATRDAKTLALRRLDKIEARGSTDLHGGWMRGAELLSPVAGSDAGVSKVMLMTDGLANEGVISRDALIDAARRLRSGGVLTSTFGVGHDFNEDVLSRIATEGGGYFYFIERPKQIPDFFASELGETLEVVARDVELEIACDPGVDAQVLNDLPFDRQAGPLRIRLGNLVSEQEVTLVVAVGFKGAQAGGTEIGVQCRMSDRDSVLPGLPIDVRWEAVDAVRDAQQAVNADVIAAVATVLAERARREALALNASGHFDDAKRIIAEVLNDLRAMASGDRRVMALVDQLHRDMLDFGEAMDPMLRKARHFASYAALHSRESGGTARRKNSR